MASGARTYSADELDEEAFTDRERAAAGLPPFELSKTPTGTTPASLRREAAERDRQARARYEEPASGGESQPSQAPAASEPPAISRWGQLASGKAGGGIASAVLGLVGYAVVSNFLAGGWPQVKGWFGAKFANVPYEAGASPLPTATTSSPGTATTANAGQANIAVPGPMA